MAEGPSSAPLLASPNFFAAPSCDELRRWCGPED